MQILASDGNFFLEDKMIIFFFTQSWQLLIAHCNSHSNFLYSITFHNFITVCVTYNLELYLRIRPQLSLETIVSWIIWNKKKKRWNWLTQGGSNLCINCVISYYPPFFPNYKITYMVFTLLTRLTRSMSHSCPFMQPIDTLDLTLVNYILQT